MGWKVCVKQMQQICCSFARSSDQCERWVINWKAINQWSWIFSLLICSHHVITQLQPKRAFGDVFFHKNTNCNHQYTNSSTKALKSSSDISIPDRVLLLFVLALRRFTIVKKGQGKMVGCCLRTLDTIISVFVSTLPFLLAQKREQTTTQFFTGNL